MRATPERRDLLSAWIEGAEPSAESRVWHGYPLIAHALGRIEGSNYTNSREAMLRAYRRGLRIFEADVSLTADGEPVLVHGWGRRERERLGHPVADDAEPLPLSAEAFLASKVDGLFTTQHLRDLYGFMRAHADVRLLIDIRPHDRDATARIYARIAEVIADADVRERCMAGCYSREMVEAVAADGRFSLVNLFYDAAAHESAEQFAALCRELGVHTATVGADHLDAALGPLHDAGIRVLHFTLNRGADVVAALARGVDAVGVDETAPENVKRAGQTELTDLAPYRDSRGNVIHYAGDTPPSHVRIRIRGRNNVLRVDAGARLTRLDLLFDNDNARVTIGSTRAGIPALALRLRAGQDSTIRVGKDVTTTGSVFLSATEGTQVLIGDDVMFATNNEVRADDAHAIFDVHSGARVNRSRSIVIGDHVWFARDAVALGGARVGEGSVIGYRSLVTGRIPNNVIAVGTPARVLRRDIAWERPHLDDYPPYKDHASVMETSAWWEPTRDGAVPAVRARRRGMVERVRARLVRWTAPAR